jgi:hypothetical protein
MKRCTLATCAGHGKFNCTVAAAKSIQAGTDVDCGPVYGGQIENAVQDGLLTQAEVDVSFSPFDISSKCDLTSILFLLGNAARSRFCPSRGASLRCDIALVVIWRKQMSEN